MDATLIRGALVPAFMRLAGNANWWAPRPLRRLYHRFGLSEAEGRPPMPSGEDPHARVDPDKLAASRRRP
jgi:RND superfamily putative drug exporter